MPTGRTGDRSAGCLPGRRRGTAADADRAGFGSGIRPTRRVAASAGHCRRGAIGTGHGARGHRLCLAIRRRRRVRERGGVDHLRRSRNPDLEPVMAGMSAQPRVEPPLAGFTVVDLSIGIAGAYCTKLLADGGATVIKVEPPEGDPLRRWSASGAAIEPGSDGALFSFLAGSKHRVVAHTEVAADVDRADSLLAAADAVVWTAGSKLTEHEGFRPAEIHRAHPQLTVTSITPFGLD